LSPKPHVARQAVLFAVSLVLVALAGYPTVGLIIAAAVLSVALGYGASYVRHRRHPVPDHRAILDRFVVVLILLGVLLPAVVDLVFIVAGPPIHVDADVGGIWFVVAAVVLAIIFSSSLIDWFWIVPRIGGLGGWPMPCTVEVPTDPHGWRFLTQLWYGHRLGAEFFSIATIVASAGYLVSTDVDHRAIWVPIGTVFTLGAGVFVVHWYRAFGNVSNPDVEVGSVIRAARVNWHPERRDLYVVDVDLRGIQCMQINEERLALEGERNPAAFRTKKETTGIKLDEAVDPLSDYRPPCADHCTGINWYCRFNPRKYDPN
jgi:hypothetical protein